MLPWKDTTREQEQICFMQRWKRGDGAFTERCRQLGISRKTGFKLVERYKLWGWELRVPSERPGLISLTGATFFGTNRSCRLPPTHRGMKISVGWCNGWSVIGLTDASLGFRPRIGVRGMLLIAGKTDLGSRS